MKLEMFDGRVIEDPTEDEIRTELAGLDDAQGDGFAILFSPNDHFMQTAGDSSNGFVLEYQEGSLDHHYHATDDEITLDQVTKVFLDYNSGSSDWRTAFNYEKLDVFASDE